MGFTERAFSKHSAAGAKAFKFIDNKPCTPCMHTFAARQEMSNEQSPENIVHARVIEIKCLILPCRTMHRNAMDLLSTRIPGQRNTLERDGDQTERWLGDCKLQ